MTRRYSAFMVRCWHLASGEWRYAVEDIQTGATVRVPSLPEALDWLTAQSRDPPAAPEMPGRVAPGRAGRPDDHRTEG